MASPQKLVFFPSTLAQCYEFGPFRIDARERLLFCNQRLVSLPLKVFETLLFLVQRNGHIVDKSELTSRLWPDTHVGPRSLAQNIFLIRKVLGTSHSQFIETVPRRGYRFTGPVQVPQEENGSGIRIGNPTHASVLAIRQLAVLPFRFLGEERAPEAEYLGMGLADALITKFSNVEELIIRPTSSILKYANLNQDLLEIGRELEVDSILEGTFQISGSRIRVTVQLVNAYNGAPLWADRFDCDLADMFALQDAISERVVQSLPLSLTATERARLRVRYTKNPEAYKYYMKGRFYWNKRTSKGLLKAIESFEWSLKKDPNDALAYAGLADSYNILSFYGAFAPTEVVPKALAAATKALEIDPNLVEAVTSLAFATLIFEWNWAEAERWFRRAWELNPNYPTAHQWFAEYQLAMGRPDEALAAITRAQELDPMSVTINRQVGWMLCYSRKYDLAIEQIQSTLEMDPDNAYLYHDLGLAYLHLNKPSEAITALQKANLLSPDDPEMPAFLAYVYGVTGRHKKEAGQILKQLTEISARTYVSPFLFAIIYAARGERDLAFRSLNRAFEERSNWLIYLNVDPALDALRPDPRFQELRIRMKLATLHRS